MAPAAPEHFHMSEKLPAHIEAILESEEPASLEQVLKLKEYASINFGAVVRDPHFSRWLRINKDIVNANEEVIRKHGK